MLQPITALRRSTSRLNSVLTRMTTIVTLALDDASQAAFDHLRQTHYPAHLNCISAHLTLFHALPDTEEVRLALQSAASDFHLFPMQVKGLMSLGRGVAYTVESPALMSLHSQLASTFEAHLTPQDKQRFRPHIVVQNKATGPEAKSLLAELSSDFNPWHVEALGLEWWNYLNGPWELRERFAFLKLNAKAQE